VRTDGLDLNGSVTAGVTALAAAGVDRVIVAHADLPDAVDLAALAPGEGVAAVTDRRRDGTNVLAVPSSAGFVFAYGPGSFERHRAEAARVGLTFDEIDAPDLAHDVDGPEDLP
jgi:2-phospho-L-lactate guanylyltransferase